MHTLLEFVILRPGSTTSGSAPRIHNAEDFSVGDSIDLEEPDATGTFLIERIEGPYEAAGRLRLKFYLVRE